MKMISASEARKRTKKIYGMLDDVSVAVAQAADEGKTHAKIYGNFPIVILRYLEKLGYSFEMRYDEPSSYLLLDWRK